MHIDIISCLAALNDQGSVVQGCRVGNSQANVPCLYFCIVPAASGIIPGFDIPRQPWRYRMTVR